MIKSLTACHHCKVLTEIKPTHEETPSNVLSTCLLAVWRSGHLEKAIFLQCASCPLAIKLMVYNISLLTPAHHFVAHLSLHRKALGLRGLLKKDT